jgi:lactate dehydrogenase-like 2-hydroxyacid dehydrogenase
MVLALNRRLVEQDRSLRAGAWVEFGPATRSILRGPIPPLRELTLGIVGFGRIGQAVAERARPFGLGSSPPTPTRNRRPWRPTASSQWSSTRCSNTPTS